MSDVQPILPIDQPSGLKKDVNIRLSDPNLAAIAGELLKIQQMLNAIKADINDAVASHAGALQSAISVADIDL